MKSTVIIFILSFFAHNISTIEVNANILPIDSVQPVDQPPIYPIYDSEEERIRANEKLIVTEFAQISFGNITITNTSTPPLTFTLKSDRSDIPPADVYQTLAHNGIINIYNSGRRAFIVNLNYEQNYTLSNGLGDTLQAEILPPESNYTHPVTPGDNKLVQVVSRISIDRNNVATGLYTGNYIISTERP